MNLNLKKNLWYYFLFLLFFFVAHLLILSIVAFLHLLLGHKFNTIEEWAWRNSWMLLLISKGLAFWGLFKVLDLSKKGYEVCMSFLKVKEKDLSLGRGLWGAMFFLLFVIIYVGNARFGHDTIKYYQYHLLSFFGVFFLYVFDYLSLFFLRGLFHLESMRERITFVFLASLMFYFVNLIALPYAKDIHFLVWLHMATMLVLIEFEEKSWVLGAAYLLFFVVPVSSLLGIDPLWGNWFSLWQIKNKLSPLTCLACWILALTYIYYTKKHPIRELKEQERAIDSN